MAKIPSLLASETGGKNNSWVKIYNSGQSNISYTETSTEMYATFLYNVSSYKYMRLIVNRIGQTYYRDYLMLIEIDYFYEISPNITAKINNSHEQFSIINGYIIGPTVKVNDINFSSFNFSYFCPASSRHGHHRSSGRSRWPLTLVNTIGFGGVLIGF